MREHEQEFPVFVVAEGAVGETGGVVGRVTRIQHGRDTWIGDKYLGFLKAGTKLISGRWHRQAELWAFVPDDEGEADAIRGRSEWDVLDGYWGERAELVLDQARRWHRAAIPKTDAIRFGGSDSWQRPATAADIEKGTGEVIPGGWDHEHCALCWETLGRGGQEEGYVSATRTWVCERCFRDFVERGSLGFIPGP